MMTQTLAFLLDAYRELHAKKMFWIVLILTIMVMAAFSVVGVADGTLSILWYKPFPKLPDAMLLYKQLFSSLAVGFWLTWVAALLALISTAGIFPDFLSSGSIDLFLAKPISRLRMFFTKYVAGLLFVTLQVTIFAAMSFVVLGLRAGIWEPGLFWSIPLVVLFFSYLFAICVLLGVWTRSTIPALLLTLLAWFGIWSVDTVDKQIGTYIAVMQTEQQMTQRQIDSVERQIERTKGNTGEAAEKQLAALNSRHEQLITRRDQDEPSAGLLVTRRVLFVIKSFVPKTRETTALLDRTLFKDADLIAASRHEDTPEPEIDTQPLATTRGGFRGRGPRGQSRDEAITLQLRLDRERPMWWVIGTSVAFEAVILGLAAWSFCKRDY
jgi:hypothetical protein